MKGNQWTIVVIVGLALLAVALLMRKQVRPAPAAPIHANGNQVSTGTSILNTLIKTAGDVTTSIFGNGSGSGSGGGSGGYSYTYTDSSLRLGGG